MAESAAFEPARKSSDHLAAPSRASEPPVSAHTSRPSPAGGLRPSRVPVPRDMTSRAGSPSPAGGRAHPGLQRLRPSGAPAGAALARPSAVPARPVQDVLRSPGQPLAAPVKEEMQARLGADLSDVRVHTGDAARTSAAEVGARAWTSGNHVVIGDGAADKHILAHELTHVIQQHQGPVAGTDHGDGLKISDPSDRFERDAEANATRALSGPSPQRAPQPLPSRPAALGTRAALQRAKGGEQKKKKKKRKKAQGMGPIKKNKAYVLGKDENRNYVLPVKLRRNPYPRGGPGFMQGVPNLFGGNFDRKDKTVDAVLNREMGEESDFQYQMVGSPVQQGAPVEVHDVVPAKGELPPRPRVTSMFMHTAAVAPQTREVQDRLRAVFEAAQAELDEEGRTLPEMEAEPFRFKANQLHIDRDTTDEQIKDQILRLFHDSGATRATATAQNEFRGAHTTQFLVDQVKTDHAQYHAGLAYARNTPPRELPSNADPEFRAAYGEYFAGVMDKHGNQFDDDRSDPAYRKGGEDYKGDEE